MFAFSPILLGCYSLTQIHISYSLFLLVTSLHFVPQCTSKMDDSFVRVDGFESNVLFNRK